MEKTWQKVINNRRNPLYWPVLLILAGLSFCYRLGLLLRNFLPSTIVRTSAPVISVGNITTGGTGKTPIVIMLADCLLLSGKKVGIVASGYRRKNKIDIIGQGKDLLARPIEDTGDELALMSESLPEVYFSVAEKKYRATVNLDRQFNPDIILIDDGFQHRRLHRDLDIVLIEAGFNVNSAHLFPLGRLREPLSALFRADILILTKSNYHLSTDFLNRYDIKPGQNIYETAFKNEYIIGKTESKPISLITDSSVYFFAGVGQFETLLGYLRNCFHSIVASREFPDHCAYSDFSRSKIINDIERYNPEYIITTFKDYIKLRNFDFGQPIYYLDLSIEFESGRKEFFDIIDKIVSR